MLSTGQEKNADGGGKNIRQKLKLKKTAIIGAETMTRVVNGLSHIFEIRMFVKITGLLLPMPKLRLEIIC